MTQRRPCPAVPGWLEDYAARFVIWILGKRLAPHPTELRWALRRAVPASADWTVMWLPAKTP